MASQGAGVRDIPKVVLTAGRLIARHWPALLALAFVGAGVRAGALWAAVEISNHSSVLAQIILIIAPLGYLLPIIAMLHLCRDSLPNVSALAKSEGPQAATEGRERRLVDVMASVLVPFLAVYVSYGLLEQDRLRFTNEAVYDEFNQFSLDGDVDYDYAGRVDLYAWQYVIMIIVIAWVLRWALGRIEKKTRFLALAFVGALVEVYYTGQVARQTSTVRNDVLEWLDNRQSVDIVKSKYEDVTDHLGWLADPIDSVTGWVFDVIGSLDAVVVVPVAWLTVGAVVLGHKLAPPPPSHHVLDRFSRIPPRVRSTTGSLLADIRERFSAFWAGLRLLANAGLVPMLLFSLVFLLVIRIPTLVSQGVRLIVGPTVEDTWLAFAPMESGLGLALSMALTAPLLAAALDWLIASPAAEEISEAVEESQTPAS